MRDTWSAWPIGLRFGAIPCASRHSDERSRPFLWKQLLLNVHPLRRTLIRWNPIELQIPVTILIFYEIVTRSMSGTCSLGGVQINSQPVLT
jgi:hypothetical protein